MAARDPGEQPPGIEFVQTSLREMLTMLQLQEGILQVNKKQGKLGSLMHGLMARYADEFGLLTPETLAHPQLPEAKIYTEDRFEDLAALASGWAASGERVGILHGAFDFPHIKHAPNMRHLYDFTDRIIVLLDPNWLVKLLKEVQGDPRPRVESMIWKMWQIATLPTVDAVGVAPMKEIPGEIKEQTLTRLNREWLKIYDKLHITEISTDVDHPNKELFKERMHGRKGGVVMTGVYPLWMQKVFLLKSATDRRNRIIKYDYPGMADYLPRSYRWKLIEREAAEYERRVARYWQNPKE